MKPSLSARFAQSLAAIASLALVMGAYAAEHGDVQDEHGDHAESKEQAFKPNLKPNLKAAASSSKGSEPRGEARSEERDAKREPAGKAEAASDAKGGVSMSELRDMIDKKIAEVRSAREPAPVVRIKPKAKPAKKEAAKAESGGSDEHGALMPAGAASGHASEGHDVHWAYRGDTGPESWGRLKPEYQLCMLGKRQSPIDIRDGIPVQLDPIQFDYHPTAFRVIDNGHTVQVNVEPGNGIVVQGHRYELVQFHFHRPSEERINGRQYEMVAHLVHKDADGKLAVVAVLMDQGKAHPIVQQVWNNLPLEKNMEQAALTQMDMTQLLPEQRQYYTYMGSLTTPPCTEGVLWMVMKNPATMSREQINVFGKLYQMNARPVQPASGRLIKDGQ